MKMRKKIIILAISIALFLPLVIAETQKIYVLDLNYDRGIVTKESILVMNGYYQEARVQPEDGYLLELVSFDNEVLFSLKFKFPLEIVSEALPEWFDENGNQIYFPTAEEAGHIILDKTAIQLIIPYFPNGKTIRISNPEGRNLLEVDVGLFAQVCGDNICQGHESYLDCPKDCPSGFADDFCDMASDGICDPDCSNGDIDCKAKEKSFLGKKNIISTFLVLFLIIIIILIYFLHLRKKNKKEV